MCGRISNQTNGNKFIHSQGNCRCWGSFEEAEGGALVKPLEPFPPINLPKTGWNRADDGRRYLLAIGQRPFESSNLPRVNVSESTFRLFQLPTFCSELWGSASSRKSKAWG